MENSEVLKIIKNLKGRRPYEEKRAAKLGFASLHEYIEENYPGRFHMIEVSEDGENGCRALYGED